MGPRHLHIRAVLQMHLRDRDGLVALPSDLANNELLLIIADVGVGANMWVIAGLRLNTALIKRGHPTLFILDGRSGLEKQARHIRVGPLQAPRVEARRQISVEHVKVPAEDRRGQRHVSEPVDH